MCCPATNEMVSEFGVTGCQLLAGMRTRGATNGMWCGNGATAIGNDIGHLC